MSAKTAYTRDSKKKQSVVFKYNRRHHDGMKLQQDKHDDRTKNRVEKPNNIRYITDKCTKIFQNFTCCWDPGWLEDKIEPPTFDVVVAPPIIGVNGTGCKSTLTPPAIPETQSK